MQDLPLITTVAVAFSAAWLFGLLTQRLRLSPIVGYLLAGILIGPSLPGFVSDQQIAHQLGEVGVILLMFGVGLHFRVKDLLAMKAIAVPGALGRSSVVALLSIVVFAAFGVPLKSGVVIGLALSVGSTVVMMRVLMDAQVLDSPQGHVAAGWSLVEDVFTVVVLVMIPLFAAGADALAAGPWTALALALLKLAALVALVLLGGSRAIPWVLVQVARLRSRELFTLTVLVFAIAIAAGAYYFFGASMALGAFLAGMVVAQSPVSHQAAAEALPLRDAFAVLFFVSVGMLFEPAVITREPHLIVVALGIILIVKPLVAMAIVALLGHSVRMSLTVALGLAQIGEFSFILAGLAREYELILEETRSVLVAAAIISIALTPLVFRVLEPLEAWLRRRPRLWELLNGRAERRLRSMNAAARQTIAQRGAAGDRGAIVVGYGPVGRSVDHLLHEAGLPTVVIDLNMDTVAELTAQGRTALFGDASHDAILEQAGVRHASHLVLTPPHSSERVTVVAHARLLNPDLRIFVRAHYLGERAYLEQAGATAAVFEEGEAAIALARLVLADTGASRETVERSVRDLRLRLILENVSNLATQAVRSIMVPWTRVHRLSRSASLQDVLREVSRRHFSRWPVVDPATDVPLGYLLTKDLVAEALTASDWAGLVRPLHAVAPEASIESTLLELQRQNATVCVVVDAGRPVGLITIEDILEQVVGRMEDEYPHQPSVCLRDACAHGGVVLDLAARTAEHAIAELAAAIAASKLPPGADIAALAIAREHEVSTDVGFGVALPHARCPNLRAPLVVFGRSTEGIIFSARTSAPIQLVFLLVTPAEQPDLQVLLLGRIARVASDPAVRARLAQAQTAVEVIETIAEADSAASSPTPAE